MPKVTLPKFITPEDADRRIKKGELPTRMQTVAEIEIPPALSASGAASTATAAKRRRLVIKCKDTVDGVICTYKWT